MQEFAEVRLGKGVVLCKDTPGFLGNRIGVFWLVQGLLKALELGISVEDADAVMGRPVGIPKTGVFGLFDLIGIDLMPHIARSMLATLPEEDRFRAIYREPELIQNLIKEGYTGRKGKGGFYRMNTEGGGKVKEAIDLATGTYHREKKSELKSVEAAKAGLAALVAHPDIGGRYAKAVLVETLRYAAALVPEISDDILNIDAAMRLGYNWKYGPFELIDRLSTPQMAGVDVLAAACVEAGLEIPEVLVAASGMRFYQESGNALTYLDAASRTHRPVPVREGAWLLKDKTRGAQPVAKNGSAKLWDLGEGILGFEMTGKGNTFDPDVMSLLRKSHEVVKSGFRGMVIGHDGENFSFGANLGFFMYVANLAAWSTLSDVIKEGQQTFMGLKYAPFPVVGAPAGMALGGGCEILLHCDAVQAHSETYAGLVEVGVGVIPGWGGCKEMLFRIQNSEFRTQNSGAMPIVTKAFEQIGMAKVSGSAEEARDMMILNARSGISMNRTRVLADAKALCLKLAEGYAPPAPQVIHLPGASAKAAMLMALDNLREQGKATPHDLVVGEHLATVLSGGATDITEPRTEQNLLDLEHDVFMQVVKTKATLARIEHMLEMSKPLRN
jgi:3-hydroxyacyl-CoA dehydrogenase